MIGEVGFEETEAPKRPTTASGSPAAPMKYKEPLGGSLTIKNREGLKEAGSRLRPR